MAMSEPKLDERAELHYAAIRTQGTMQDLMKLPHRIVEIFGWLAEKGEMPLGAPFMRYLVIDGDDRFDVEVGVPVENAIAAEGDITPGVLPAGQYAVMVYTGPFSGLHEATKTLLAWGERTGVRWETSDGGKAWGANVETYVTDPRAEPDPQKWQTELAILVAGGAAVSS
ncbi:GyrI-like domain-containing protein [Chondromyces crocatus]|nr:GyrI-like domain-containing protein [Chondromyces crocatus]